MKLVMKFGGTTLGTPRNMLTAMAQVKQRVEQGDHVINVASASGDTTDVLVEACNYAVKGKQNNMEKTLRKLRSHHAKLCSTSINDAKIRRRVSMTLDSMFEDLRKVLTGVTYLGEITPRIRDYILSFGERLSSPIVSACLESMGVKSRWLTGGEAGIITDSNFGEARPLIDTTMFQVGERLNPLLEQGITPVVTGFIAVDQNGVITTIGRGGSDFTATLLGAAVKADEVCIWSDVDGLMTADPRIEPTAQTIPAISFPEAVEMAFFGAKMMHPLALKIAMLNHIPVRVRNIFNIKNPGTLINAQANVQSPSVAKAVSLIRRVAAITVSGAGMTGAPGVAGKVFDILGKANVNILMITQGSSEANISLVIPRDALDRARSALETALTGTGIVDEIICEEDVCVVACVGAGMKGTPGVAALIFNAVAQQKANIRMIAQGSSELNISLVVKEQEGPAVVRALHKEFGLGKKP